MTKTENVVHAKLRWREKVCGARAKQNEHRPCRQPAMKNGRCRMHGGKSTGPKTEAGKLRSAYANFKHGHYCKEAIDERRAVREMMSWRKNMPVGL